MKSLLIHKLTHPDCWVFLKKNFFFKFVHIQFLWMDQLIDLMCATFIVKKYVELTDILLFKLSTPYLVSHTSCWDSTPERGQLVDIACGCPSHSPCISTLDASVPTESGGIFHTRSGPCKCEPR